MTERPASERLFRAWGASAPPSFDEAGGRARFLDAFAAAKPRPSRRYVVWALAPALVCVIGLWVWRSLSTVSFKSAGSEGQAGAWLATGGASELPLTFSEGSEVVMAPDSRGRVEALDRSGASFLLERGEVRAHVVHQTNTNWRFLAGPFEVRVTGTALGVDWDPTRERFAVHVDEGSVMVRGPNVGAPQMCERASSTSSISRHERRASRRAVPTGTPTRTRSPTRGPTP